MLNENDIRCSICGSKAWYWIEKGKKIGCYNRKCESESFIESQISNSTYKNDKIENQNSQKQIHYRSFDK